VTSIIYSEADLTVWQMPAGSDYPLFLRSQLGNVTIARTDKGKPYIPDSEWRFNVSHSGEYLLVVLSRGSEVGVDIEQIRPVQHLERLVERYFSGEAIRDAEEFSRAWVRRESLLKGIGIGLGGLSEYRVVPAGWRIVDLPAPAGYAAALALYSSPTVPPQSAG
jgi:4'-phosphopantetheinyl transferase